MLLACRLPLGHLGECLQDMELEILDVLGDDEFDGIRVNCWIGSLVRCCESWGEAGVCVGGRVIGLEGWDVPIRAWILLCSYFGLLICVSIINLVS